jgi:hypothetical protein
VTFTIDRINLFLFFLIKQLMAVLKTTLFILMHGRLFVIIPGVIIVPKGP